MFLSLVLMNKVFIYNQFSVKLYPKKKKFSAKKYLVRVKWTGKFSQNHYGNIMPHTWTLPIGIRLIQFEICTQCWQWRVKKPLIQRTPWLNEVGYILRGHKLSVDGLKARILIKCSYKPLATSNFWDQNLHNHCR